MNALTLKDHVASGFRFIGAACVAFIQTILGFEFLVVVGLNPSNVTSSLLMTIVGVFVLVCFSIFTWLNLVALRTVMALDLAVTDYIYSKNLACRTQRSSEDAGDGFTPTCRPNRSTFLAVNNALKAMMGYAETHGMGEVTLVDDQTQLTVKLTVVKNSTKK